jgi:hypothetical protein
MVILVTLLITFLNSLMKLFLEVRPHVNVQSAYFGQLIKILAPKWKPQIMMEKVVSLIS